MTTDADVIVAGAGPAGALAAYGLASRGVSVLVLEKADFPRYKVCGAGLTHKILQQIPFDISPVIETRVDTIVFSREFSEVFSRTASEPMIYCTNRDKLDDFLLKKALDAGARVKHGELVTEFTQDQDLVTVKTRTGTFTARVLIGAEGAGGHIARAAGLHDHIETGLAWEAEISTSPEAVSAFSHTVFLDWGAFPGGYAWVFPKGDHFSVGVGGPASLSKWMMPYYDRLLEYLAGGMWDGFTGSDLNEENAKFKVQDAKCKIEVKETLSLKSWPIPVRIKKSSFHKGRVLVAGDAAGLTDPLTGEGIYYAIRSGILAAECSHRFITGVSPSLESYSTAVNAELMEELLEANRLKHVFNTVPGRIHHFVRDNDRAWRAFNKILRGERLYADVKNGFGNWKWLWGAACEVSHKVSVSREKKFAKFGFK